MEKSKRRPHRFRNPLNIILLLLTILIAIIIYGFYSNPMQEVEPECYEQQVTSMTIQQVSDLLDMRLAEVTWLPDDAESTPVITTRSNHYPSVSRPDCYVSINYPIPISPTHSFVNIDVNGVGGLQLTKMPLKCSWNFTTDAQPTGSQCNYDLDGLSSTLDLAVYINPQFSPEQVIQILDSMQVVEPISGTHSS